MTRTVLLVGPVAIKVPRADYFLRGWLGNQSEWHQRRRPDVNRPWFTLGHFALVSRRADKVAPGEYFHRGTGDEAKCSSWGRFDRTWKLIDFDRSWQGEKGLIRKAYYAHQDRLARRWADLPSA